MVLVRIDKLHLFTRASTKLTQGGQCIVGAPLVLERAMGNTNTQDSSRPRLGGNHHLPLYSILCASTRPTSKWHFVPGLPNGSFEIAKVGFSTTLGPHNFMCKLLIEMRSKAELQPLSRAFQGYIAHHLHARKSGRFPTFSSRESNCQFDFRLSF